jgi:hypothetical protein
VGLASFPVLKCGAVAQYPSDRVRRFATRVHRFVGGKEQRSAEFGAELKRWVIRLERLDEAELAAVEDFFASQAGRAGVFEFTDPWSGAVHANCSFDGDVIEALYRDTGDGALTVAIKENR